MQKKVDYAQGIVRKYPEQIVIGIARDARGIDNPITLGWTMIVSARPPMMAVAIGKSRYSREVFQHARQFVLAFPSEFQEREARLFGTCSGRDVNKFAEADTPVEPAREIKTVLLTEAVANFECTLVAELETGDHVVFVGEVVCAHVNENPLSRLYTVGEGYAMKGLPRG